MNRYCLNDRDYRNEDASAESWLGTRLGVTDLLFAGATARLGRTSFMALITRGSEPRGGSRLRGRNWEARPKRRSDIGGTRMNSCCCATIPAFYENNHIDGSWQGSLRRTENLQAGALLLMGLEADGDSIRSNNLGLHARNRGAGYVDVDLRPAKKRWSLSAGAREEIFSGGAQAVFSPETGGKFSRGEQSETARDAEGMDSGFRPIPISITPIRRR